jgi:HTH-type transcriptional regulator / antitoxin HigA
MISLKEHSKTTGQIEILLKKGFKNLSYEELVRLEELGNEVADFEKEHYTIPAPETLSEMIELRMYELKLNQKSLAERMGISPAKLSLILNGKQEPDLFFLKQCKKVLNIPAEFILEHA